MRGERKKRKWSLKSRLLFAFLVTSIIPVIIMNLFSYYNTSKIVADHVKELTHANLQQARGSLDVWLESYEDILFQVYTDDDIVSLIDKINRGENVSVSKNQLRRTLHGLFYTKEYIKSITILTENGTIVFYDLLTGSSTRSSWLDNIGYTSEELYHEVSSDNDTHVFSTQPAIKLGAETHYLFHLGHRIIDYRDVNKKLGIVMVSVDEELLASVCSSKENVKYSYNFIVDAQGNMVSYPEETYLTSPVIHWNKDEKKRRQGYQEFVEGLEQFKDKYVAVDSVHDEKFNWDIVNVSSQNVVMERLSNQQKILMVVLSVSLAALAAIIVFLIRSLTGSLQNLAKVMQTAGKGDLSVRVETESRMPSEVETISGEFNKMLGRLSNSIEKEKEAAEKQKAAEIAALEAQINPHFLYNTLDTINWMAIDKEEYEISNSINALANILRYGIDNSNGIVTVRQEQEWLKKYLFLQQTRMKNAFSCEIHVEQEAMDCRIHKLLLQPFVENAIIHGFEGIKHDCFLSVTITLEKGYLQIVIYDNGKGIERNMTDQMNQGIFPESSDRNHIGMENAISRMRMYYGTEGNVKIESEPGEYTRVHIRLPLIQEAGQKNENCSD
ncbi:MAG: sensor histidine kinase [Eubacteriales bacterium]|nr:sensor histidine kinase [Eubacteriales bacterium]